MTIRIKRKDLNKSENNDTFEFKVNGPKKTELDKIISNIT